jgi:hypothetical protein
MLDLPDVSVLSEENSGEIPAFDVSDYDAGRDTCDLKRAMLGQRVIKDGPGLQNP